MPKFRAGLAALGLQYVVGVQRTTTLWPWGNGPLAPRSYRGRGRPPQRWRRATAHQSWAVRDWAPRLAPSAYRTVTWREGRAGLMRARLAALKVRCAHRNYGPASPHHEQWLLIEWPTASAEPTKKPLINNLP
jgi:SRSO17 transposase